MHITARTLSGRRDIVDRIAHAFSWLALFLAVVTLAATASAQCVGSCGGMSPAGCWCDESCFDFSDCCDDVCAACPDLAGCQAPGACCFDGGCKELPAAFCADLGGEFLGAGTACPPGGCDGPPTLKIELLQLVWVSPDGDILLPKSNYGQLVLTIEDPESANLWVNASIKGDWVVRNQIIMARCFASSVSTYVFDFPFLSFIPAPGESIPIQLSIDIAPRTTPPDGTPLVVPVQEHFYAPGSVAGSWQAGPEEAPHIGIGPPVAAPPPSDIQITLPPPMDPDLWILSLDLPGVSEHNQHCVPGAFARILAGLNKLLCLDLPKDNSSAEQIYNKLRNSDHMATNEVHGTKAWDRTAGTVDTTEGKMMSGLQKFLDDKGLNKIITAEPRLFVKQDTPPAVTPCDLFDDIRAGYGVVVIWAPRLMPEDAITDLVGNKLPAAMQNMINLLPDPDSGLTVAIAQQIIQGYKKAIDELIALADEIIPIITKSEHGGARSPGIQHLNSLKGKLNEAKGHLQAAKNLDNVNDIVARVTQARTAITEANPFAQAFAEWLGFDADFDLVDEIRQLRNTSANNAIRGQGHAVTVVGAMKHTDADGNEVVRIQYRDDAGGGDQQGDGLPDKKVKTTEFRAGGATGWTIDGNRWEGYVRLCPDYDSLLDALLEKLAAQWENVFPGIAGWSIDEIKTSACHISDLAQATYHRAQSTKEKCPDLFGAAVELLALDSTLMSLTHAFVDGPTDDIAAEIGAVIKTMTAQAEAVGAAAAACDDTTPDCVGDLNGDGLVDVFDLLILLGAWGACDDPADCPADLNGSGTVDVFDLLTLLAHWGSCPT